MDKQFSISETFLFSIDTISKHLGYIFTVFLMQIFSWGGVLLFGSMLGALKDVHFILDFFIGFFNGLREGIIPFFTQNKIQNFKPASLLSTQISHNIFFGMFCLVAAFFFIFLYLLISLGYTKVQLNFVDGKQNRLGTLFSQRKRVLRCLFAQLIYFFSSIFLYMSMILPGIIFFLIFGFFQFALVDEGTSVLQAFKRSREISRGARMQLFALYLVSMTIYSGVGLVFLPALLLFHPVSQLMFAHAYRKLQQQTI